jgi:hypothetical protein
MVSKMSKGWPFETVVRDVVAQLARRRYADLETRTNGVRLSAGELAQAVREYGRRVILPPDGVAIPLDVVPISGASSSSLFSLL